MAFDGGKGGPGVYQSIINMMPPHKRYVEAFLGSGAVLLAKRPAEHNIAIEKDNLVASAFMARTDGIAAGSTIVIVDDAISSLPLLQLGRGDLVYCDPPYVMSTRSCQRPLYRHEMDDADHCRLIEVLYDLSNRRAMVMISGYDSEMYNIAFSGWRKETFQTVKRNGQPSTECVWLNFPKPIELHDYQYLGRDFRERERIKRKANRWRAGLLRLPDVERYAIMAAIDEACDRPSP